MDHIVHRILRFDRFALDLARGCLRADDQEIEMFGQECVHGSNQYLAQRTFGVYKELPIRVTQSAVAPVSLPAKFGAGDRAPLHAIRHYIV